MTTLIRSLVAAFLLVTAFAAPVTTTVHAGANDPLFVNVISDDAHRARMAIVFTKNQMERGHPVTFFFNDKAVKVVSRKHAGAFGDHQKILAEMMAKGATVLVCPMCMKHYDVAEGDLVAGAKTGNPELVGGARFKDNGKTLTW